MLKALQELSPAEQERLTFLKKKEFSVSHQTQKTQSEHTDFTQSFQHQTSDLSQIQKMQGTQSQKTTSQGWTRQQEQASGAQSTHLDSTETRTSASFEAGLRLDHTPFADLPAGSLVLIQMPQYSTHLDDIIDIQVVRNQGTYVVHRNSKLFFVVNDCVGNSSSDSLTIQYAVNRPQGEEAAALSYAMQRAVQLVERESANYLASGDVSSQQMQNLRLRMRSQLVMRGIDPEKIDLLNQLFEEWISYELVQLESKVRVIQLERRAQQSQRKWVQLQEELKGLRGSQEISKITQLWALDNLDLVGLGKNLRRTMSFVKDHVVPLIRLRYPSVSRQMVPFADEFYRDLAVSESIHSISDKLVLFVEEIKNLLTEAKRGSNIQEHRFAAIAFPSASHASRSVPASFIPSVEGLVAQQPWDALRAAFQPGFVSAHAHQTLGILKVDPTDLYAQRYDLTGVLQRSFPSAWLPNNAAAPLVESVALYFRVLPGRDHEQSIEELNRARMTLPLIMNSDLVCTLGHCIARYQPAPGWRASQIPVFFGTDSNPDQLFQDLRVSERAQGQGAGLSPFGEFHIPFDPIVTQDGLMRELVSSDALTEMVLVFQLNFRTLD